MSHHAPATALCDSSVYRLVTVAARWLDHRDLRVVLEIYSRLGDLEGVDEAVLDQLRG